MIQHTTLPVLQNPSNEAYTYITLRLALGMACTFFMTLTIPNAYSEPLAPVVLLEAKLPLPPINTDRPTFTPSVQTIPEGSLQIENGITWNRNSNGNTVVYPETELRLGLTPENELQVFVPSAATIFQHPNQPYTGIGDGRIGFKHAFTNPMPYSLKASINGLLSIPMGNSVVSSAGVDPSLGVILAREFTPRFTMTHQTAFGLDTSQTKGKFSINPSLVAAYAITPQLSGFCEYAAFIPIGNTTSHIVDAGVQYIFKQHHAVDARTGVGLFSGEGGAFAGVGYSYRIDGLFGKR